MPNATKRPLSEWRETEWLQYLQRQAQRPTACPHYADDLAHTCLLASTTTTAATRGNTPNPPTPCAGAAKNSAPSLATPTATPNATPASRWRRSLRVSPA
jgi:hypothetical protein